MYLKHKLTVLLFLALSVSLTGQTAPYIILKLDDLHFEQEPVHAGWKQVIAFLQQEQVTAAIGIVGKSLEKGDATYFNWIKQRHREGFEIWNHGFCHCKPVVDGVERREFEGMPYQTQLENLQKTQRLMRKYTGITLRSFGAPYNATDSLTARALEQIPELKVWMYNDTPWKNSKMPLDRIPEVNIEYPVHIPNLELFKAGYAAHRSQPVLVIQGHPRSWVEDPSRFEVFKQIVWFLKAENAQFTTPYAYHRMSKKNTR